MNPYVLEIPKKSPTKFESNEELKRWVDSEVLKWKWFLTGGRVTFGAVSTEQIAAAFSTLTSHLDFAIANKRTDHHDVRVALSQLSSHVTFLSDDPRWKFCEALSAKNTVEACTTLCALQTEGWESVFSKNAIRVKFRAALNAAAFENGWSDQPAISQTAALSESLEHWLGFRNLASDELSKHQAEHAKVLAEEKQHLEELCESIRNEADAAKKFASETTEKISSDLRVFENTLKETLALQAPVTYWNSRAAKLRGDADKLKGWLITAIVGVFFPAIVLAWNMWKTTTEPSQRLYSLALILAVMGFAIWPVRLIARLYMSAVHLEADALERETMVLTYLSLAEAGHATPTNRRIILASLFRPTQTGIVTDDGSPAGVIESLMKVGQPSQSKAN